MWALEGGLPLSIPLNRIGSLTEPQKKSIFFAQISDSHIGFSKDANKDVTATLQEAVAKLNALPQSPAFVLHTGDITQLAKPEEFDTAQQVLTGVKSQRIFYVPGEHDVATDNGASYLQRYGKGTKGGGWYSFDHSGVHFVGLVNVLNLKAGGLGTLGAEQLDWLSGQPPAFDAASHEAMMERQTKRRTLTLASEDAGEDHRAALNAFTNCSSSGRLRSDTASSDRPLACQATTL